MVHVSAAEADRCKGSHGRFRKGLPPLSALSILETPVFSSIKIPSAWMEHNVLLSVGDDQCQWLLHAHCRLSGVCDPLDPEAARRSPGQGCTGQKEHREGVWGRVSATACPLLWGLVCKTQEVSGASFKGYMSTTSCCDGRESQTPAEARGRSEMRPDSPVIPTPLVLPKARLGEQESEFPRTKARVARSTASSTPGGVEQTPAARPLALISLLFTLWLQLLLHDAFRGLCLKGHRNLLCDRAHLSVPGIYGAAGTATWPGRAPALREPGLVDESWADGGSPTTRVVL